MMMRGLYIARHLAQHGFGFVADSLNCLFPLGTAFMANRNDGRFIQNDTAVAYINQGVCSSEINGQVG
jgi:hypothetical protein